MVSRLFQSWSDRYGVEKSLRPEQNRDALEQFLAPLAIAEFTFEAALVYGQIRADLEKRGTQIGSLDTLIAAHAVSLDVPLVTANVKEFSRIPELKIEDWMNR